MLTLHSAMAQVTFISQTEHDCIMSDETWGVHGLIEYGSTRFMGPQCYLCESKFIRGELLVMGFKGVQPYFRLSVPYCLKCSAEEFATRLGGHSRWTGRVTW